MDPNEPTQNPSETNSREIKITDLPDELLEVIFLKMPQKDLHQNVVLVCHRFKNIIYHPKFTPTVTIQVWPNEFECTHVKTARKVLKIYPNSKFEFFYDIKKYMYDNDMDLWFDRIWPIKSSITNMAIHCDFEDFEIFMFRAQFENLESLDLNIDYTPVAIWEIPGIPSPVITGNGPGFENYFPTLKSLKLRTNRNTSVSA